MKNGILEAFKASIIKSLNLAYGYCGVAESEHFVSINSTDKQGNNITIELKEEIK